METPDLSSSPAPAETPSLSASTPRKAALAFIFVTVTLDMLALGMIAPVLPRLITQFEGGNTVRAAEFIGVFGTVWALMQFVFSPVLGSLSDRFGRRTVILLSNFGMGLDYLVMAVAPTLGWLFAGRLISGVTAASIPTAMAYIADVTPPEKRSAGFGVLSAAFGLGFVLGPALGGVLGSISPRLPFWVAGAFSLVNAMYGLFVLPESLPLAHRSPFSWRRANPLGALVLLRSHAALFSLAMVLFLGYVAHQVLAGTYVLYADYRYNWSDRTVGLSLALVGICSAVVGAVLVKPVVRRFGERPVMLFGLLLGSIGFAMFGMAATGSGFWLAIPVWNLWGLAGPTAQSLMSGRVSPSEQGQLQGAINGLRGIAGLMGPALFSCVFAASIRPGVGWHLPGAPFYLAALILFSSLLLGFRITCPA
jgi:DHA1 family tetracycline resistance protein-like MFS transporter